MKANDIKCHLLLRTAEEKDIQDFNKTIKNSYFEKQFYVFYGCKLKFDIQIEHIYRKTNQKLNAFVRVTLYIIISNRRLLKNSFSLVKSNYSPVTWMLHSRFSYYKLNKLRERCLYGIHNDRKSCFGELLENDRYISIHYINMHAQFIKSLTALRLKLSNNFFQLHGQVSTTTTVSTPPLESEGCRFKPQ